MPAKKIKKEITIYDIADKLHLSSATVSRALKDHPAISKATKKKIQDKAKELGYRHNTFASNLRRQNSNTIGIIVPSLKSNFIASVLTGIEHVTSEAGYDLVITTSSELEKKEAANAMNLFHKRVDGIIASLSVETKSLQHFQPFVDRGIPVVFFDRVDELSHFPKIIIDNYRAGFEATVHMIEQGCKRIAIVTADLNRNVYEQRLRGYKDALKKFKLKFNPKYVIIKDLSEEGGIEAAKMIVGMDPRPDGVFVTSDFTAAVCMQQFKEHGLKIPKDIAVVGFNNDPISKIVEPQLTTINYPAVEIGSVAGRNLIELIQHKKSDSKIHNIYLNAELIVRGSTKRK